MVPTDDHFKVIITDVDDFFTPSRPEGLVAVQDQQESVEVASIEPSRGASGRLRPATRQSRESQTRSARTRQGPGHVHLFPRSQRQKVRVTGTLRKDATLICGGRDDDGRSRLGSHLPFPSRLSTQSPWS